MASSPFLLCLYFIFFFLVWFIHLPTLLQHPTQSWLDDRSNLIIIWSRCGAKVPALRGLQRVIMWECKTEEKVGFPRLTTQLNDCGKGCCRPPSVKKPTNNTTSLAYIHTYRYWGSVCAAGCERTRFTIEQHTHLHKAYIHHPPLLLGYCMWKVEVDTACKPGRIKEHDLTLMPLLNSQHRRRQWQQARMHGVGAMVRFFVMSSLSLVAGLVSAAMFAEITGVSAQEA